MTTQENPVAENGEGPGVEAQPNATISTTDSHSTPQAAPELEESADGSPARDGAASRIWVTLFDTARSKTGKRSGGTFAKWCGILEDAPVAPPDLVKEALPAFSPTTFRDDQRGNDKVEAVHFLVTEHDNDEWVTLDETDPKTGKNKREKRPIPQERRTSIDAALALWDGISRAAYTSWSHTPEHHRFRILLELSRPVTADEHGRVWRWMHARAAEAGHVIDQSTRDPARLWFLPRQREGREYVFRRVEGKPLDVDEILKQVPPEPPDGRPDWNPDTRLAAYVKELEGRIDMPDLLVSDGIELRPHGSVKVAFSPFRDDGKKPSFVVYPDHAYDFVTCEHYSPIGYWRKQHGVTFWEALDALADRAGLDRFVRADANKPIPVDPQPRLDAFLALDPVPVGEERTKLLRAICAEIATQDKSSWPTWVKPIAKKCGVTEGVINAMVREAIKEARTTSEAPIADDEKYVVEDGKLCAVRRVEGGTVNEALGDFDAWVSEVVTHDDGAERRKLFTVEGKRADGTLLPPVEVRADAFDSMDWVTPAWNGRAVVAAGRGVRDSLRAAIQTRSKPTEATVYGDLGWHVVDGHRVYLHAGGAVGGGGEIRVHVPDELERFTLPDDTNPRPGDPDWDVLTQAIRRSIAFLKVAPPEVTYPMYATIWTAPLLDFMPFDAVVCVVGKTQAMKSSLALECQKHHGPFGHTRDLPLNFESTRTAIELILHAAKDALVVVDDYYPRKNPKEAEKQKVLADFVIRTVGNRESRRRANANVQLRASRPPRALVMMTCEEDPAPASEGESAAARTFKVVLEKGTVDKGLLTAIQGKGQHALVMRRYVEELAKVPNLAAITQMHARTRDRLRGVGLSDRMPDVIASMLTGLELFFRLVACVAFDTSVLDQRLREAEEVLVKLALSQDAVAKKQEPDLRYLDTVRDALTSGRAKVVPTKVRLDSTPACREIGWYDAEHVYLHPKETHILVSEVMRAAGEHQPWRLETVYDALVKRGYASPRSEKDHVGTRRPVGGGRHRIIELPRQLFEDVCIEKSAPVEDPVARQELEEVLDAAAEKSLPN